MIAATQWRTANVPAKHGFDVLWIGLDHAGALAGLAAAGISVTPELWAGIRTMEAAAIAALNGE